MEKILDAYGRIVSPELTHMINYELRSCDQAKAKEERIHCKFDLLYMITQSQDIVNLSLMKTMNDDKDDRWIPVHMVDNANAIILSISEKKGRPLSILRDLYVSEKINALNDKWRLVKIKANWEGE
jgi:hypothetical protein